MIKHRTYVIHIKCHTLKGDRYLLETATKAGREIKILCGTLLCRRASQRLLLPREAEAEQGLGEITLICIIFVYEVL